MIKLPIKYKDFDDVEVTEEHYFHLSKSELIDLETGGEPISAKLERAGRSADGGLIMRTFKELIAAAYGQRVDGSSSQFYKDPDLTKRFMSSLAFDQLLEDLLTNTVNAIDFVNGLMPSGLAELAAKVGQQQTEDVKSDWHSADDESGLKSPRDGDGNILPWAFREPTKAEMSKMTQPQILEVYARKSSGWKPPVAV